MATLPTHMKENMQYSQDFGAQLTFICICVAISSTNGFIGSRTSYRMFFIWLIFAAVKLQNDDKKTSPQSTKKKGPFLFFLFVT